MSKTVSGTPFNCCDVGEQRLGNAPRYLLLSPALALCWTTQAEPSVFGRLTAIDTLNAMGAGYGCQLVTVLQDLNQLKELYPQSWETFLAASGFQLFFAPRDWTTSDYISRMWGTVETREPTKSFNRRDVSHSISSREHRAMLPEQVRQLGDNQMVAFVDYAPGYDIAYRRPYYQDPAYAGRWDDDPYHPRT